MIICLVIVVFRYFILRLIFARSFQTQRKNKRASRVAGFEFGRFTERWRGKMLNSASGTSVCYDAISGN